MPLEIGQITDPQSDVVCRVSQEHYGEVRGDRFLDSVFVKRDEKGGALRRSRSLHNGFISKMIGLTAAAFLMIAPTHSAVAREPQRNIELSQDSDYLGFNLRTVKDISLSDCQEECIAESDCAAFTYNPKARWCFLKNDFRELSQVAGSVA